MSSGSPSRCMATRLTMRSYIGESLALGPTIPGAITLHVTLWRAPPRAADLAKPNTPTLVGADTVWPNPPMRPAVEAMEMIPPQPPAAAPGKHTLVIVKGAGRAV